MDPRTVRFLTTSISVVAPFILVALVFILKPSKRINITKKVIADEENEKKLIDLIGNTPLILIPSLSKATGCTILGKAEFMNPGGSPKDRVALSILRSAEKSGILQPGGKVFEGTVGSTGISLAMLCNILGYECHIVLPNDVAQEKIDLLSLMGANLQKVPPASIVNPDHYVNVAKRRAVEEHGLFMDQFENDNNFLAHFNTTGPEIFKQTKGRLDVFVSGAGTGGTLAGVTRYLKPRIPGLKVVLADPHGSGLFNKVKHDVMYASTEAEGTRRRHQVDTLVEGIGINRMTQNFYMVEASVNDAVFVTDQEAVSMSRYVLKHDGLFLGSSSSVHLVACVKLARYLGPDHRLLTILSDSGSRHITKFWSRTCIESVGLTGNTPETLDFIADLNPSEMKI